MATLLQDRDEFDQFCQLLKAENVRSYLEIGSWTGQSIKAVAEILPKGSRIVSVDMPFKETKGIALRKMMDDLKRAGYDTHLFLGDSGDVNIVRQVRPLGPFDAVFIDGDHRFPYVKSDWENYGTLGRIVGFHDISRDMPKDQFGGGPHQAHSFWEGFKNGYKHVEFISDKTRTRTDFSLGIGVVWASATK
jgi:predicted O-methyltransferase YrrM